MIRSKAALSGSAYLSMFFLGVGNTIIGAADGNIGLDAYQIGLLLAAQNLGFFGSVVAPERWRTAWKSRGSSFSGAWRPACRSFFSTCGSRSS